MNVLSLFDGMSCGRIALERAGIPVTNYFASEIDPYAIKVSKANWPDIRHIGDVTKIQIEYNDFNETIITYDKGIIILRGKIDLLIGGSPCQGFSNAGEGLNFSDPRSKLFFEYVRLLNEIKPKYFFLENVKMKKEWADIISEKLGVRHFEICSGVCSATDRTRYYWTNIPNVSIPEINDIRIKDILESEVSVNYLITEAAFKRGMTKTYSKMRFNPEKCGTINTKNNSGQMSIDSGTTLIQVGLADGIKGYESKRRVYSIDGKCPTLLTHQGGHHHAKIAVDEKIWRRLTPLECERIHNVPDRYTNHVSETQRYRMLGNGWECNTITHIFKNIPV